MAEERQRALAAILGWRTIVFCVIAMIVAAGLAWLLIPQLSAEAAVRGTTISIVAFLPARLGVWLSARFSQSKR
jgi:hypothetical protein